MCATLVRGTTILGWTFGSMGAWAPPLPRSVLASTATGGNSAGGPSRFGESSALERSRPRNSPGLYSSASDMLLHTSSVAQRMVGKAFFRIIQNLLKHSKGQYTPCEK